MKSCFQKYIVEELDSFGEFNLQEVVPKFLEKNKNQELLFPLSDYQDNYKIDKDDFSSLLSELKELIKDNNLCFYRYNNKDGEDWEETFDLITEKEVLNILTNKEYYIYKKDNPIIYLSTCDDNSTG